VELKEFIFIAINNFFSHPLRTFITMLGIIVSVAAVICIVSVGTAADNAINSKIRALGPNMVVILPGGKETQGVHLINLAGSTLTIDDAKAIKNGCLHVKLIAPILSSGATVSYGKKKVRTDLSGITPSYHKIRNWYTSQGEIIDANIYNAEKKVCLLGATIAKKLFPSTNPIGKFITINNRKFQVIGVMEKKGSVVIYDLDNVVFIPLSTMQKRMSLGKSKLVSHIFFEANSSQTMEIAKQEVRKVLRKQHNLGPTQEDDFTLGTQVEIFSLLQMTSKIITLMLGAIASISILVGGIGIMNIMLVSVSERTREIGLRKAVGAKDRDILYQFLIESILLSIFGGVIGITIGVIFSSLLTIIIHYSAFVPIIYIISAFIFSALVGLAGGIYPALQAYHLSPIEALRYE